MRTRPRGLPRELAWGDPGTQRPSCLPFQTFSLYLFWWSKHTWLKNKTVQKSLLSLPLIHTLGSEAVTPLLCRLAPWPGSYRKKSGVVLEGDALSVTGVTLLSPQVIFFPAGHAFPVMGFPQATHSRSPPGMF